MRTRIAVLLLATVGVLPGESTAQRVQSFDDLSSTVRPGASVVVRLDDGRSMSGTIVSLSGDQIEIRRRRGLFRSERLSLPEASVRRIEERDSTWNGTAAGVAAGALVAWIKCRAPRNEEAAWKCLAWVPMAPAVGALVGDAIDRSVRQPLYIASGSRVQVRPLLGAGVGVAATIGF